MDDRLINHAFILESKVCLLYNKYIDKPIYLQNK